MNKKMLFYGTLVVMLGFGAILVGRAMSTANPVPVMQKTSVLTVARDIPAGTFLEEKDVVWRETDGTEAASLPDDALRKGQVKPQDLSGAVLRVPLAKGAALTVPDFIRPGESAFLAAVLKPGSRAITIRIDAATGGAELIRPGNRVDVVLSGKLESNGTRTLGLPAAKTLLEDVRVIAMGQETEFSTAPEKAEKAGSARTNIRRTATLEVGPKEVELLTVAQNLGDLSLSLRSLLEGGPGAEPGGSSITSASELVHLDRKEQQPSKSIVVIYGTEQSRVTPR